MKSGTPNIQPTPRAQANDQCRETVKFILRKNILCGDALTLRQADGSPIVFAEWSLVTGNLVKRRDYALEPAARQAMRSR